MVLIDSSKPRKVFYQVIELLKKASLKWAFDQDLKKKSNFSVASLLKRMFRLLLLIFMTKTMLCLF
ncbi:hypothetical protein LEP1GSC170_1579 [Leptospira interrogans serovar Bataviae str. HAI135]|nr:hypothetical protein LEP1GSC170_1579 [Leptospira interrogans serovar Bataviae str. HAI135]